MTDIQMILKSIEAIQSSVGIINHELGLVQMDVAVLKSEISGLIWISRAIIGAFIILFSSQIWRLITSTKNHSHNNDKK